MTTIQELKTTNEILLAILAEVRIMRDKTETIDIRSYISFIFFSSKLAKFAL